MNLQNSIKYRQSFLPTSINMEKFNKLTPTSIDHVILTCILKNGDKNHVR